MHATELRHRIGAEPAAYVESVLARVTSALGERLVGAWLFGSGALGDFSPERSDIDIQAIAAERLPAGELTALAESLLHDVLPSPAKGLELVVYANEDLDHPQGPAFQLNLNTGARMEHHLSLDPNEDPRFWFVVDVSIGRRHGVALAGPPALEAFPDPPRPLVVASLLEALDWYEKAGGGEETAKSASRAWAWASDGRWRSKTEAVRWAEDRLAGPVDSARAIASARAALAAPGARR